MHRFLIQSSYLLLLSLGFVSADTLLIQPSGCGNCLGGKAANVIDNVEGDYLNIYPNSWHNGWVEIDTMFGSRLNLGVYEALTFKAKAIGFSGSCEPRLNFYGGAYPRRSSNTITLKGSNYVEGGELVENEYRQVVVPVADLVTDIFPLDQIQNLIFLKCSSGSGYTYRIQDLRMTDNPPDLGGGGGTTPATETSVPSNVPTMIPPPAPSDLPSSIPTTSPSMYPSRDPSSAPTDRQDLEVWTSFADGYSEEGLDSCLYFSDRGITTQETQENIDHILVVPDSWRSGGLLFGCLGSENGVCTYSCFSHGTRPDLSPYGAFVFQAKLDNGEQLEPGCEPRVKIVGGGSPAVESETIILSGIYVDAGTLVSDEWRQVVIPVSDLQNTWDLNGPKTLRFLQCGSDFSNQPIYRLRDIRFTDDPPALITPPPTSAPTVRVTEHPSLATHIKYHRDWFPIVDTTVGTWLIASDGVWPTIPAGATDHEYSILIPQGSPPILYSQSSSSSGADVKLDQVVIESGASLEISDQSSDAVTMILSTLRVEEGGTLTIKTSGMSSSIEIQFDGEVNTVSDPTELMNGLVSLGGNVLIQGRERCSKMEEIAAASSGSNTLIVRGRTAFDCWGVGDELLFPDTQQGLEMGHWDFSQIYNPDVAQTESSSIIEITYNSTADTTSILLDSVLQHSHLEGAHVAMVSRSIVLRTSVTSASRGHILHTGNGSFDVMNARVAHMGRTTVEPINSTVFAVDESVPLAEGLAKIVVSTPGSNQIARYALHAHHSLVPMTFSGNVIIGGLRFGIVAHNSRVSITDNVVYGVEGSSILLEDGTETGPVMNNFLIGTGGTGEGDGLRFTPSEGMDFGFGGFGIWSRTAYSPIEGNVAEGVFGESPYAFFLHINFMEDREVPPVDGTPPQIIGKTRGQVQYDIHDGALSLNTYGSFKDNSCLGSWVTGFSSSYFFGTTIVGGHVLENFHAVALAQQGSGLSFGHSSTFTFTGGSITAINEGNTIVGVVCSNGDLVITDTDFSYIGVSELYGGCLVEP